MSLGIGIDVGSVGVKVVAIRRSGGGVSLEYYRHFALADLVAGDDPDPREIGVQVSQRLRADGLKAKHVVLGVSGRDAIIRYSHLPPMPEWRLALLMDFEIEDAAERTGEPLSADFKVLPSDGGGNLVLVALAKDARVTESLEGFESAGIEVGGAVPQPVAVADAFRFLGDEPDRDITLVLDIGARSTEIALVEEGELIFARSVALGGDSFTERLAGSLGLSQREAEQVKLAGQTPQGDDLDKLLRGPRSQLAGMVSASVEFAKKQLKRRNLSVERCVVSGGTARTPGLLKELGRTLECEAELLDPLADLGRGRADRESREHADAHGPEAVTAAGLALSGILPGAIKLDLLPLAVKEKLEFKHRTVWLYAAAGILAAAVLISFAVSYWGYSAEKGRRDELAQKRGTVDQRLTAHEDRAEANEKREADLRTLADRARAGYHLSSLLVTLGRVTPKEISISEGSLVRDERAGSFHFEFSGLADDAQGTGGLAMRTFEKALGDDPLVGEAKILPQGDEGTARRFKLTIVPTGNPAEPADDDGEEG